MPRVFSEGFRIFFLSTTVFAVGAMALWAAVIAGGGVLEAGFAMPASQWHAHEMIFGFGGAAMGGFFLTAVPNWTGAKAAPARFNAAVFALWLAGRLAMALSGWLPPLIVALACLAFLPVLAAKLLTQLLARPKPQNMLFLAVLTALWTAAALCQFDWLGWTDTAGQGLSGALLLSVAMIAILGGRVTPAFTRNAMTRAGIETGLPVTRGWAERAGIALPLAVAVLALAGGERLAGGIPAAVLASLAGLALAARLSGWRGLWTRGQPILWALHLAYALAAAGLVAQGAAWAGWLPQLAATHVLGIGAVGGMILAVSSRATLGHAGLPLVAPPGVALAYAALPAALALRLAALAWPGAWAALNLAAAAVWTAAFAAAAASLWPAWTGARAHAARDSAPAGR